MELPVDIGLISLRELAPTLAHLRAHHQLNMLNIEALAAATQLRAQEFVSVASPLLEEALKYENLTVRVLSVM